MSTESLIFEAQQELARRQQEARVLQQYGGPEGAVALLQLEAQRLELEVARLKKSVSHHAPRLILVCRGLLNGHDVVQELPMTPEVISALFEHLGKDAEAVEVGKVSSFLNTSCRPLSEGELDRVSEKLGCLEPPARHLRVVK